MPNVHHQDDQMQDSVKARAKIKLERDLGPEIMAALADPKTVEIMLNSDGKLWQPTFRTPPVNKYIKLRVSITHFGNRH